MMATPEGVAMYEGYMEAGETYLEDTTGSNVAAYAESATMYYYMNQYYATNGWPQQTPYNQRSVCYNSDFAMNGQNDDVLYGFTMYDGMSNTVPSNGCNTVINWIPLPLESRPTVAEESNASFRFDLNPTGNGDITGKPYSNYANFHSFELFEDEPEEVIPGLLSSTPPSGRKSLKINNTHTQFHVNRLSRKFDVDQHTYYFSFATVMENPPDHGNAQPYFTVRLTRLSDNVVVSSRCYVSDINDPFFDWVPAVPGKSLEPVTYRSWTCDTLDLTPYYGDSLQIDFIAADCDMGGHWGYVYISDLCVPCEQQPQMGLDSIRQGCLDNMFDINGFLQIDTSAYTVLDLYLNIYRNENIVGTISDPIIYDVNSGLFNFKIDDTTYHGLPDSACFDVRALAVLINPYGDTITVTSVTANPNGPMSFDNDFCTNNVGCPLVAIDSFSFVCNPENFELCGTFSHDTSFILESIELEVFHDDIYVTTLSATPNINAGAYCFKVDYTELSVLSENAFDIQAKFTYTHPNFGTVVVYSSSTNPGLNNDWIYENCCPTDTIHMDFSTQFCLLGQGSEHQHLTGSGSILLSGLPAGFNVCGFLPESFEGATIKYFTTSYFGGIFKYEVGIIVDDWSSLTPDGYFIGSWQLCNSNGDTCAVPVKIRILMSQSMMCGVGMGQMCMNYHFLSIPATVNSDGRGNSCVSVNAFFPFDKIFYTEDTCIINSYDVSFYLNRTGTPPLLLDSSIITSSGWPDMKKLSKVLCWPSVHDPLVTGMTMKFTNNCGDTCSVTLPLSVLPIKEDGVESRTTFESNPNIMCYPNPATSQITIEWHFSRPATSMSIINQTGQIIHSTGLLPGESNLTKDISKWTSGVYWAVFRMDDGSHQKKAFTVIK